MIEISENIEFKCVTPVQIRFCDLDTLGHVNNSVYFNLMDHGKSDYFNKASGRTLKWTEVTVVIANINCDFLHQTLYDEPIAVKTRLHRLGNKSFTLLQQVENTDTGEVKCRCLVTLVYINPDTITPEPLPPFWRDALTAYDK